MCGGGSDTQTVEQTTKLPAFIEDASKENLDISREVASRPYEPYPGQRIADFTQDTRAGFDAARQNIGSYVPFFNAAGQVAGDVGSRTQGNFTDADIGAYMDPFIQQVINRSLGEVDRDAGIERNQINASLNAADAYGGSRHGVIESEQRRNTQELKMNLISSLLSGAYSDATRQYQNDQGNQLSSDALRLNAAGLLPQIGAQGSQLGYGDAASLMDIGGIQQALEQQGLDVGYADFLRQFGYPVDTLNLRSSTLAALPYGSTTFSEQPTGNSAAGFLGGAGALAGGIGSLVTAFSSKDFKEDDAPAESILKAVKELPVRAWRYKEEMGLGTERHVGPYAEDFNAIFGLGDGKTIPFVDLAGVNLAATKELAERVDDLEGGA